MLWLVDCSRRSGRAEKFSPELQATAPDSAGSLLCARAAAHGGFLRPPQPPAFRGDMRVCPLCPAGGWRPALLAPSTAAFPVLESPAGPRRVGNAPPEPGREQRGSRLRAAEGPQEPTRDAPGRLQQVQVLLVTCLLWTAPSLPRAAKLLQAPSPCPAASSPRITALLSQPGHGEALASSDSTGETLWSPLHHRIRKTLGLGSKPGFQLQRWVQERQGTSSCRPEGSDRAARDTGWWLLLGQHPWGERRGMPQSQGTPRFLCSRARRRQQGCRGALLPGQGREGKQDSRERRHGSVPATLLSKHSLHAQHSPTLPG